MVGLREVEFLSEGLVTGRVAQWGKVRPELGYAAAQDEPTAFTPSSFSTMLHSEFESRCKTHHFEG